jgi:hypothetical protein
MLSGDTVDQAALHGVWPRPEPAAYLIVRVSSDKNLLFGQRSTARTALGNIT